jgi:hypothetical protein
LLLKFFEIEARFPRGVEELPPAVIAYVAEQVKVDPAQIGAYSREGRSIKYHRKQIRAGFGFREFTRGDEDKLAGWLGEEVCPVELRDEQLREAGGGPGRARPGSACPTGDGYGRRSGRRGATLRRRKSSARKGDC